MRGKMICVSEKFIAHLNFLALRNLVSLIQHCSRTNCLGYSFKCGCNAQINIAIERPCNIWFTCITKVPVNPKHGLRLCCTHQGSHRLGMGCQAGTSHITFSTPGSLLQIGNSHIFLVDPEVIG